MRNVTPDAAGTMRKIVLYAIPNLAIFAIIAFFHFTPYAKLTFEHIPFHSAVEAAGAAIALVLSALLLSSISKHRGELYTVLSASALMGMGILDLFHSLAGPGQVFVWLHTSATFVGGVLFSLVWLEEKIIPQRKAIPVLVLAFSSCFAFLSLIFPEIIPAMLDASGTFTPLAATMNLVGGSGFFLGSAWFFTRYAQEENENQILFANLCLLFGVSGAVFELSTIWNLDWWLWHATRLLAYLLALALILRIHRKTENQKEALLRELQDAMSRIKVLRGFLPICASCKKIRDDQGYWKQIESYIREHSEAEFSHSICPECAERLYPELKKPKKEPAGRPPAG